MNVRFKTPILFGLICSSLTIILGIVGIVYLVNYDNFFVFFEEFMSEEYIEGTTLESMIFQYFPSLTIDTLRTFVYIYFIVSGVMAVVLSIPCFVLSLLSFKDSSLDANEFQKRNKKHIFLLISFGLAYLANSYELGSTVVPTLSIFSLAAGVLIIFGFFKVLQQIRFNKYYLKVLQDQLI